MPYYCKLFVLIWNNPNAGFCWFGCLSSGVDPVVNSYTQSSGHFTGWQKNNKITNNKQKMEGKKDKHGFRTAKRKLVKLALFRICGYLLCSAIAKTRWKSYTATKDVDTLGHRLHCFMSLFLTPYHSLTTLDSCLRADWPAQYLELECLTFYSLLTDQQPSSFLLVLQVHAGTALCVAFMPK